MNNLLGKTFLRLFTCGDITRANGLLEPSEYLASVPISLFTSCVFVIFALIILVVKIHSSLRRFLVVKAKDIPPLHAALADLYPYFPIFYDAFESGTDHAKGYFEGLNAIHDPWLQAHLIRHWVKLFLQRRDVTAEDYQPENLAMSGLQFCIKCWFIRMRKSERGEVPSPGRSRILQAYYRQN